MKNCAFERWKTFTFSLLILEENLRNGFKHHTALDLISSCIISLAIIFNNACVHFSYGNLLIVLQHRFHIDLPIASISISTEECDSVILSEVSF